MRVFTALMIMVLMGGVHQISRKRSRPTAANNAATNGTPAREAIPQRPARSNTSAA